jgi:hypothetical protein
MGVPQGVEIIYRDFGKIRQNLSVGGFVFPSIDDKAYYNVWARWGNSKLFGEINYILWSESLSGQKYRSSSLGITLGTGLTQF